MPRTQNLSRIQEALFEQMWAEVVAGKLDDRSEKLLLIIRDLDRQLSSVVPHTEKCIMNPGFVNDLETKLAEANADADRLGAEAQHHEHERKLAERERDALQKTLSRINLLPIHVDPPERRRVVYLSELVAAIRGEERV